jgi:hypothetical protein
MLCKCGIKNNENSNFCSNCGLKLEIKNDKKVRTIPNMLTVKEAHSEVFKRKLSLSKIYELVRLKSLPHVNAGGKILLDVEKTIDWWNDNLKQSTVKKETKGLLKII